MSVAVSAPIGRLRQLARDRHERDLALCELPGGHPRGLWFDEDAADRVVQFIEDFCRHSKGELAGELIVLEDWQKDEVLRPLFGWMRADGTRRFRDAYIEIPRKNGKSLLGAAVGLYLTVADNEPGAEVYSSATKKDQAKLVHDAATAMVKASPELKRFLRCFRNNISCEETASKFEPLAADSDTLDGLNPHGNIIDELHAHKDRGVHDVLKTAMGARRQPLNFMITTAGTFDPTSIGWEMHDYAVKVLEGAIEDDTSFAFIAAMDPGDDWTQPETWHKANPNLGVSIKLDYLAEQCEKAQTIPSYRNTFLRLHLNLWTEQAETWVPVEAWDRSDPTTRGIDEASLAGRVCYGGLDLSQKLDITALTLDFPLNDNVHAQLYRFWVPEDLVTLREQKHELPSYSQWAADGFLLTTPGNVIDYDFIQAEIEALAARFEIAELAFDTWSAQHTATKLGEKGLTMVEFQQGFRSMSEPAKEFEKLIVSGKIRHGGHPVMRWMMSNVAIAKDPAGNIKPDKKRAKGKIDGVVSSIMALGRAHLQPAPAGPSVYETRGVMWL